MEEKTSTEETSATVEPSTTTAATEVSATSVSEQTTSALIPTPFYFVQAILPASLKWLMAGGGWLDVFDLQQVAQFQDEAIAKQIAADQCAIGWCTAVVEILIPVSSTIKTA